MPGISVMSLSDIRGCANTCWASGTIRQMVSRGGKMLETAPLSGRHETEPLVAGNTSSEAGAASASPASPGGSGAGASARVGGPGGTSEETTQVRRGRLGELSLALDTLMDSGLGDHSAQDVERFLSLYAVGVDSHVSMESVTISLSVSAARGCAIHIAAPSFFAWARLHAVVGVHTPGRSSAHSHSHLQVCFLTQRDGHR